MTNLDRVWDDIGSIPRSVWFRLVGFITIGMTVIALRKLDQRSPRS